MATFFLFLQTDDFAANIDVPDLTELIGPTTTDEPTTTATTDDATTTTMEAATTTDKLLTTTVEATTTTDEQVTTTAGASAEAPEKSFSETLDAGEPFDAVLEMSYPVGGFTVYGALKNMLIASSGGRRKRETATTTSPPEETSSCVYFGAITNVDSYTPLCYSNTDCSQVADGAVSA